jgi:hypothetical protein
MSGAERKRSAIPEVKLSAVTRLWIECRGVEVIQVAARTGYNRSDFDGDLGMIG